VIVACTAWGIDPDTDSRFIKNGKSVVDALLSHYLEDKRTFQHIVGAGSNAMATDQACYALIAYDRFINGEKALYDMSDVLDANLAGAQTAYNEENDSYAVRFVATINEAAMNSQSIVFKIKVTYEGGEQTFDIPVSVVYTQVYENNNPKTAAQLMGGETDEYICAVVIKDISATKYKDVDITFTVKTCVTTEYGNELTDEGSWVFTNGELQK
jgi:hypothetical protein